MIAVDTNVVLRLLVKDDSEQRTKAQALLDQGVMISLTVLVETEWVLRSAYGFDRQATREALADLLALQGVNTDDAGLLQWALDRHGAGADWADMIHLIDARRAKAFATFDRRLSRGAGRDAPIPIKMLK